MKEDNVRDVLQKGGEVVAEHVLADVTRVADGSWWKASLDGLVERTLLVDRGDDLPLLPDINSIRFTVMRSIRGEPDGIRVKPRRDSGKFSCHCLQRSITLQTKKYYIIASHTMRP